MDATANSGGTALMFAAGAGHAAAVLALLEAGADPNIVVAATPEYIENVVKAISEGKPDVEPHKDGITALMLAAEGGHLPTVQILVEHGAAVDVFDDENMTPLLNAVIGGHIDTALYLVQHGANANDEYRDSSGKLHNLLMDAVTGRHEQLALALIEAGANVNCSDEQQVSCLTEASYLGQRQLVQALLAAKADTSLSSEEGITALIAAASEGHVDIVTDLLVVPGTDINARDKDGTNSLMAACVRGHLDAVKALIVGGINVNSQNNDGHTALMFAYNGKNQIQSLKAKYHEFVTDQDLANIALLEKAITVHGSVISSLLDAGADPSIKVTCNPQTATLSLFIS